MGNSIKDIVLNALPNIIAHEICSVQPMTTGTTGMYNPIIDSIERRTPKPLKDNVWIYRSVDGIWATTYYSFFKNGIVRAKCPVCKDGSIVTEETNWFTIAQIESYENQYEYVGQHECGALLGIVK